MAPEKKRKLETEQELEDLLTLLAEELQRTTEVVVAHRPTPTPAHHHAMTSFWWVAGALALAFILGGFVLHTRVAELERSYTENRVYIREQLSDIRLEIRRAHP